MATYLWARRDWTRIAFPQVLRGGQVEAALVSATSFSSNGISSSVAMSTPGPEGDRLAQEFPVGIDLGTTYSVLAYIDATGRPLTVPNRAGDLLTPSAILIDENDILVGKEAVKNSVLTPDRYAECFKRDMGEASCRRKLCQMEVPRKSSVPWCSSG